MTQDSKTKILCLKYEAEYLGPKYFAVFLNEKAAKHYFGDNCTWAQNLDKWFTTSVKDKSATKYELIPIIEYSYLNAPLLKELELLRRGVELALNREKHPSYKMELDAVLQTADLCIRLTKHLIEKIENAEVTKLQGSS